MQLGVYDFRITCDVCGVSQDCQSEQYESKAIQAVMNMGWRVKFATDLCPNCAKETKGMSESAIKALVELNNKKEKV